MFKNLLLITFALMPFQATAAMIGNLTYDGSYITGDGRTYLPFDNALRGKTYSEVLAETADGGLFEDYRLANTSEADFFLGSLLGDQTNPCAITDGIANYEYCGLLPSWRSGIFGSSAYTFRFDFVWFDADESFDRELGQIRFQNGFDASVVGRTSVIQWENWGDYSDSSQAVSWLLVDESYLETNPMPEPAMLALFGVGLIGIGAIKRRQKVK